MGLDDRCNVAQGVRDTRRRRSALSLALFFCGRWLTVLVLLFAAPGAAQIVQEGVAIAVGDDCCDGPAEDGAEAEDQDCPGTCADCACCAHPKVLPASTPLQPASPVFGDLDFSSERDCPDASGYRAPPFRPPAV